MRTITAFTHNLRMQVAEKTRSYLLVVKQTLLNTVPKAIVYHQVKQAEEHLLSALQARARSLALCVAWHVAEEHLLPALQARPLRHHWIIASCRCCPRCERDRAELRVAPLR